jgi:hypothetical protein
VVLSWWFAVLDRFLVSSNFSFEGSTNTETSTDSQWRIRRKEPIASPFMRNSSRSASNVVLTSRFLSHVKHRKRVLITQRELRVAGMNNKKSLIAGDLTGSATSRQEVTKMLALESTSPLDTAADEAAPIALFPPISIVLTPH